MTDAYTRARKRQLPKWLGRDKPGSMGQGYQESVGAQQDAEDLVLKEGVKTRFAHIAPADALPLIGADRTIERAPIETDDDYRSRLAQAFDLNYWIGARRGMQQVLAPYGYELDAVHVLNNYETGLDPSWYSRVLIIVDPGYALADGLWDDPGTWDDGGTWDSNLSAADVAYFRREIRRVKAPGAMPIAIVFSLGGPGAEGAWESSGTWDDGGTWDEPEGGVLYLPLFHVWDESTLSGEAPELWDDGGAWEDDFIVP